MNLLDKQNITMEEFEKKYFTTEGRPTEELTSNLWIAYLMKLRPTIIESTDDHYSPPPQPIVNDRSVNNDDLSQYEWYCFYINSVLDSIREPGEQDYCYYLQQIKDLLRFEKELLRVKYIKEYQCFKVWLPR